MMKELEKTLQLTIPTLMRDQIKIYVTMLGSQKVPALSQLS